LHKTIGFGIRQGLQEHSIDHREDCRVRADPQRKRSNCGGCKTGAAAQHAARVTNILQQNFKELRDLHRSSSPMVAKRKYFYHKRLEKGPVPPKGEDGPNVLTVDREIS
jgi:hypothetical protein